jgi:hypothetical protein
VQAVVAGNRDSGIDLLPTIRWYTTTNCSVHNAIENCRRTRRSLFKSCRWRCSYSDPVAAHLMDGFDIMKLVCFDRCINCYSLPSQTGFWTSPTAKRNFDFHGLGTNVVWFLTLAVFAGLESRICY